MLRWFSGAIALTLIAFLWAASAGARGFDSPAQNAQRKSASPSSGESASTPAGESSSRDTQVDLSPPPGEPGLNLNQGAEDTQRKHKWDPHKADKNVEIGDFYFKRKNYAAAISRYREALRWQDNHALAMYRLGEALERTGQYAEARHYYEGYLRILPEGQYARSSQQALQRLKDKPDKASANPANGADTGLPRLPGQGRVEAP